MAAIAWTLFCTGAGVAAFNAYLSVFRYPLHRLRGRSAETYRHASGLPLLGTLLAFVGWYLLPANGWHDAGLAVVLVANVGGPQWFVAVTLYSLVIDAGETSS